MAEASARVAELRPVTFRYTEEFTGAGERPVQFGLIAEEVAELFPHLVTLDREGKPLTVRYDLLAPLLLNELQKLQATVESQKSELVDLRATQARMQDQQERLAAQEARLSTLWALVEERAKAAALEAARSAP